MTATNHALTGGLMAIAIPNPMLAVPLAFAMHFAMDAIPHFGLAEQNVFVRNNHKVFKTVLTTDVLLAALFLVSIPLILESAASALLILACMLACMSPDLVWGWHFYHEVKEGSIRPKRAFSRIHKWIQWSETEQGIIVELLWMAAILALIVLNG